VGDHVANCDPTTRGRWGASDLGGEADEAGCDGVSCEGSSDQDLPSIVGFVPVEEQLRVEHVSLLAVNISYGCGCGRRNPFDATVIRYGDRDYHFNLNLMDHVTFRDVGVVVVAGWFGPGEMQRSRSRRGDRSRQGVCDNLLVHGGGDDPGWGASAGLQSGASRRWVSSVRIGWLTTSSSVTGAVQMVVEGSDAGERFSTN